MFIFFYLSHKAKETKAKISKWDLVKAEVFFFVFFFSHSKGNHDKMKRQPMGWEKIFANDATDKGLISKILKFVINGHY